MQEYSFDPAATCAAAAKDNDEDKMATCIIRGVNRPLLQKLKRLSFESAAFGVEELWRKRVNDGSRFCARIKPSD